MTHSSAQTSYLPPAALDQLLRRSLAVGVVGAIASLAGALLDRQQFLRSYLVAWLFALAITLGCLAIAMLHHLSRGAWGLMIRRVLEAATRTLPLLVLLGLPLAFGLSDLYVWARPDAVAADELLQKKIWYLNTPFFLGRAAFYFVLWGALAFLINKYSLDQDRTGDQSLFRRLQAISAPGLGLFALSVTFAAIDWLMSLDPHWYSSLFGVYFLGGQGVSALAFVIPVALFLSRRPPLEGILTSRHFHDYGKLLLAFVMLWAYFSLSQFLIIWSGNLQEEVVWYRARTAGGWRWFSLLLILLHFALPFLLLLSQDLKKNARRLAAVGLLLLVMRWADLYWLAAPAFGHGEHSGLALHWLDLATLVAVAGLWLAAFFWQLKRRPLLPINDPFLKEALPHEP